MAENLPTIVPQSKLGSAINKIVDHSAANTMQKSKDFRVNKHTGGMTLHLRDELKNHPNEFVKWRGEFNPDEQYSIHDQLYVEAGKDYFRYDDPDNAVNVSPGTWICVAEVPSLRLSNALIAEGYDDGTDTTFIRVDGVNYYPVSPEPTTQFVDVQFEEDQFTRANIRYWKKVDGGSTGDARWS